MTVAIRRSLLISIAVFSLISTSHAEPLQGQPMGRLFPSDNWWNTEITWAPVDWRSGDFIYFINRNGNIPLHPDLGGNLWEDDTANFGFPYITVDWWQPKVAVNFLYWRESDGVDHATGQSYPFYPIPEEAIWQAHWIQQGYAGIVDVRVDDDRHMLIVDRDNNHLYELYNVWFDQSTWQWYAGSGAFWDMNTNDRRPDDWGSSDESGLQILPGVLRYDEVYGPNEIEHSIAMSVENCNGWVYPASNSTDWTPGAIPLGGRLRLKADKDISGYPAEVQKVFRALKKYGMIVTTLSGGISISGSYDVRWNNDIWNPAFESLTTWDFEVIELGWGR